jgi:hypothetical protein
LAAGPLLSCWLLAQTQAPIPAKVSRSPEIPVPARGPAKLTVDTFRELLAMGAAERKQYLGDRAPEAQKLILAKVREYESMKPDFRELRLQATELRYYLEPLMNTPATNRAAQLALVPERLRQAVAERLRAWDKLPPLTQQEFEDNEAAIRYFTQWQTGPPPLPEISPARREKLDAGIRKWRDLDEDTRRKIIGRFNQFFELTEKEKEKALNTLSEPERRQTEKTLDKLKQCTPSQREQIVRAFDKFARLGIRERNEFLKNADRWRQMRPDERQDWRELVNQLPEYPPWPPGLEPRTGP